MKKTLVSAMLVLLAIVSCKKDPTPDPDGVRGSIHAMINGTSTAFNYGEYLIMDSLYDYSLGGNYYYFTVSAENKNADEIYFIINSLSPIIPGTYPCKFTPLLTSIGFKNYGTISGENYRTPFRDSIGREYTEGSITITEMTATHVKGIFNARARRETPSPGLLIITEGSFDFLK